MCALEHLPCARFRFLTYWALLFVLFRIRYINLESCVVDPHLDMVRLPQQPLVQVPCTLVLAFIFFEVDVCFPNKLWHIQGRLLNAKLEYGSPAVKIVQASLKLR